MNAARTAAQIKLNLKDSVEEFYKYASSTGGQSVPFRLQYTNIIRPDVLFSRTNRDTIASGHGLSNEELVDVMTKESASAYDFLSSFDIDLNTVTKLGGILRRQPVPFQAPQPSTYADVSITGHSRARTHRPSEKVTGNVGWEITSVRTPAVFAFYQCLIVTEVSLPPMNGRLCRSIWPLFRAIVSP